ncbi:MAG: T9SS type A sorting domain-containing protein [bacterium]
MGKLLTFFAIFIFPITSSFGQSFEVYPTTLPGFQDCATSWGDFDKDGDLDLVISGILDSGSPVTRIYRNNSGQFDEMGANLPSLYGGSVAWGDYDNDNDLDLLLSGTDYYGEGATLLYRNDNGSFHSVDITVTGVALGEAAWIDYNNDSWLDIIVTGDTLYDTPVTRLFKNNGNGTFTSIPAPFFPSMNSFVAIGDYNNDGWQDVLLAGYSEAFFLTRFYRNEQGNFVDTGLAFDSVANGDGVFTDYDKDGDLDLFFIGTNNQVQYVLRQYRNEGNGAFTDIPNVMTGEWGGEINAVDFNNDGYPDLGVTGSLCCGDALTKLYANMRDGTFEPIGAEFVPMASSQICFGDFDNDGDADFLLCGFPSGTGTSAATYIYQNMMNNAPLQANTPPAPPDGLSVTIEDHTARFIWNSAQDDNTPSLALSYNLRVGLSGSAMEALAPFTDPSTGFMKVYDLGNVSQDTTWALTGLPDGTYYWSVQAIDHSSAGSAFAQVESFSVGSTGINVSDRAGKAVSVMPNPAKKIMMVSSDAFFSGAFYQIRNISGQMLMNGMLHGTSTQIETEALYPGIYLLILNKDGRSCHVKFIKE